ncbi:PEP-utilizing enzyme [Lachnospiraceae bacterium CLA-AA-H183]
MKKTILTELEHYGEILEEHFRDMVDIEFTVENDKLYILSAYFGNRSALANLKIVMSMFCEGKMSVQDVITKIPYQQVESLLDEEKLVNTDKLELLGTGMAASAGVGVGEICFFNDEAEKLIENNEQFIFCQEEISPEMVEIVKSKYCKGVITARGGITSHAAVICRKLKKACVTGISNFYKIIDIIPTFDNRITVDGNNGSVYTGVGEIEKTNFDLEEVKLIYKLLMVVIKNNIITDDTIPLIWRLWDVIALHKRYRGNDNTKLNVIKKDYQYISFKAPLKDEIDEIFSNLQYFYNANIMVEDFLGFLFSQLSAEVSAGMHYLYMRPLMNPMDTIKYHKIQRKDGELAGIQLTGVEFFNVNRYVDFLLDIYSIKIYFSTEFFYNNEKQTYYPLNYLDFTNINGEGLIINTYNAKKVALYINDVLIPQDKLMQIYHLIRRRRYHWEWYEENNVSKNEILDYLKKKYFYKEGSSKLYFLCEELNLLYKGELTLAGKSLIGRENMENDKSIDYILNEVLLRGYDDKADESNNFLHLIQKKEFKDLIALEIYESYFWNERHEFDLQLLKEIVNNVCNYFNTPEIMQQIEAGLLQTLPSAIIISMISKIWSKIKEYKNKKNEIVSEEDSSWLRIKRNIEKIDKEFLNHDYILSDDIEQIFATSREEILPLLKLYGCECFFDKKRKRTIWLRPGIKKSRTREILKNNNFKY